MCAEQVNETNKRYRLLTCGLLDFFFSKGLQSEFGPPEGLSCLLRGGWSRVSS